MGRVLERAFAAFGEEARRRGIDYQPARERRRGHLHRRRPGAPDHLQPARERVPLDAGRRADRPRAERGERRRVGRGRRLRARASRAEEAERIFRPFWSRDGGGTGLGLAIAHELAHALGGRIELDSTVGQRQPLPARPARTTRLASAPSCRRSRSPRSGGSARRSSGCRFAAGPFAPLSSPCVLASGRRTCCCSPGSSSPRSSGDLVRWVEARDGLRRLLRRLERGLPGQRRPRCRERPAAPAEARAAGGARRALRRRAALVLAAALAAFALGLRAGARPALGAPAGALPRPAGGVHALAAERRAARRDGDRRPLRDPRGRGRRGGRRAHLALAAALHRAARALPRAGEAAGRARARGAGRRRRAAPSLSGYSLGLVDQLVTVVAAATIVSYSLYTFGSEHSTAMMATIPFVVFGLFRYLLLVHRDDLGEEPEQILLCGPPDPGRGRAVGR